MSFFDKSNLVSSHTLEESLLQSFPYKYGLYYLYYQMQPYGGPIMITEDFLSQS